MYMPPLNICIYTYIYIYIYICIYIYIYVFTYLYIIVVPFSRSRARNQYSPLGVDSAKSHFSWCPVLGGYFKGFLGLQRRVLGSPLEASRTFFPALRPGVCKVSEKDSFGVFLGGKSIRLLLQKHANRTVHPSKIEGVLPMV